MSGCPGKIRTICKLVINHSKGFIRYLKGHNVSLTTVPNELHRHRPSNTIPSILQEEEERIFVLRGMKYVVVEREFSQVLRELSFPRFVL
jgi:hypothetical protein